MKTNDIVLFTGWRIDYPDKETWLENEPVELISVDHLFQIGCYPNRYTVRFDDGEEQDCVRGCLRALPAKLEFVCSDCGASIVHPELCMYCFAKEIGF